jgi:Alr-MurF fusion protein
VKYAIEHIGEVMAGSFLQYSGSYQIEYLLTDSRRLLFAQSSLFIALPGPRRNGSQFIKDLYDRGVRNFVVSDRVDFSGYGGANFLLVASTLEALQKMASLHRSQFDIPVVGITGSNGKTVVKEWLNQLLEDQYTIVRSPRSYNSQVGVPLSVWQINEKHDLGVFEAGISEAGEMEKLEKIIRPTIGIFTNIGEAHAEGFESVERKIQEKILLFRRAGVVIFREDDPLIAHALRTASEPFGSDNQRGLPPRRLMSWGMDPKATVHLRGIDRSEQSASIQLGFGDELFSVEIPFADNASVENAMHCVCTLLYLGLPIPLIREKFLRLAAIAMRLEVKTGINHCTIINDSYSADLSSLKIALDFLVQQQQHRKRTVILSDFLQSGMDEAELYWEIARLLQLKKISHLIAIGSAITRHQAVFHQALGPDVETSFFVSTGDFIQHFQSSNFRDETILVKGARVFQFEHIETLLVRQAHQTLLEINLDQMAHNLRAYQQILRPSTKTMVMVKAFAYGMGSYEIANFLQFQKVDYLAVAYADEAVELRRAGISLPIMVMNIEPASFVALLQYPIEPVIYSFRLLDLVDQFVKKEGITTLPIHLEIETGMNRLGFPLPDLGTLVKRLQTSSLRIMSVFSHLAASEESGQDEFTRRQADRFLQAAAQIQAGFDHPILKHLANSAAIIRHPELQLDMVRLGIGLYGIDLAHKPLLQLREVSTLKTTIAQIRTLHREDTVGYNRKGLATEGLTMATVRIGYADGYPRSLGNGNGKMWLKGRLVPTLGSICMDMTMVDISGVPGVEEGDEILVFGQELPVEQVANWAGTIPYEIITGVSQRVKRVYFKE